MDHNLHYFKGLAQSSAWSQTRFLAACYLHFKPFANFIPPIRYNFVFDFVVSHIEL